MITLPADLIPYLRDYAYTTLSDVAAEIADIAGRGNSPHRTETLAVRPHFDATIALLDALGWTGSESQTDVTLDAQSVWAIRQAVAIAKSVEYDRLNEFDSLDRGRRKARERMGVLKRLSDLRKLEAAIGPKPPATPPAASNG